MIEQGIPSNLSQRLKLLWFAFLTSPVIFGVVGWVVFKNEQQSSSFSALISDPLALALWAVSLGVFLLGFRFHRLVSGSREVSPRASLDEDDWNRVPGLYVIRLALFESIAFFGLVAAALGGDGQLIVPFCFLSLVGMILSNPTETFLKRMAGQPYA